MLKSPLLWKMITLGGAMILLLIPLMMVRHTIVERADYRSHVEAAIRQSTSGPQKVVGPLVAVPVTEIPCWKRRKRSSISAAISIFGCQSRYWLKAIKTLKREK